MPPQEPLLAPQPGDALLGLAVLLCGMALAGYWNGPKGVLGLLYICIVADMVSRLWHRDAPLGKLLCIVLVPPVLLVYCLPKQLRRALDGLPCATA